MRGIAIGAVMLFHAENGLFPGGALGVDAFFMLSAYLITTLLCRERGRTGRVDLKAFYLRRAFRLMPALLLFTFLVATPLALLRHESNVASSVVTTLLYLSDFARAGVAFRPWPSPSATPGRWRSRSSSTSSGPPSSSCSTPGRGSP